MQNTNVVVIVGNLTRDPELRHTPSGMAVCSLRVAVNDRIKRDDQWQDTGYFFTVTVWGSQGESCAQYLVKGRKVCVSGRLTWREWEGQDGNKREAVEITAHRVEFLTPRMEGDMGAAEPGESAPAGDFGASADADDEIPFMPTGDWSV